MLAGLQDRDDTPREPRRLMLAAVVPLSEAVITAFRLFAIKLAAEAVKRPVVVPCLSTSALVAKLKSHPGEQVAGTGAKSSEPVQTIGESALHFLN
jgi:hypothetical protein